MKKKTISMLIALVLVLCCVVGGTLAWLTTQAGPVTNTFTTSDINITLKETKSDFQMVPGSVIEKDPKVTVVADSEKCYLFVKVKESTNLGTYITYSIADGWSRVEGTNDVFYRVIDQDDEIGVAYSVLTEDKVTVNDTVTKADMEAAKTDMPQLAFKAFAVQLENIDTAEAAWATIPDTEKNFEF